MLNHNLHLTEIYNSVIATRFLVAGHLCTALSSVKKKKTGGENGVGVGGEVDEVCAARSQGSVTSCVTAPRTRDG